MTKTKKSINQNGRETVILEENEVKAMLTNDAGGAAGDFANGSKLLNSVWNAGLIKASINEAEVSF